MSKASKWKAWRDKNIVREREKERKAAAARRVADPLRHAKNAMFSRARRLYGISGDEVLEMLHDQNGQCPICHSHIMFGVAHGASRMTIDHCHDSGQVRGLLCDQCNKALGLFQDDPEILASALSYLAGM